MKRKLFGLVLIGLLFAVCGCTHKPLKRNTSEYIYENYEHPDNITVIQTSKILSVKVKSEKESWQVAYNPEKDNEKYYSAWEVTEGYSFARMADISQVGRLFEAVGKLTEIAESHVENWDNDNNTEEKSIVVFYEAEGEILSIKMNLNQAYSMVPELEEFTSFSLILKLPLIKNLEDIKRIDLSWDNKDVQLIRKRHHWYLGKKEIAEEEAKDLYQIIIGILLQGETDTRSDYSDTPYLTVSFVEKSGQETKIEYINMDERKCNLRIDQTEEFWVRREDVDKIISAFSD